MNVFIWYEDQYNLQSNVHPLSDILVMIILIPICLSLVPWHHPQFKCPPPTPPTLKNFFCPDLNYCFVSVFWISPSMSARRYTDLAKFFTYHSSEFVPGGLCPQRLRTGRMSKNQTRQQGALILLIFYFVYVFYINFISIYHSHVCEYLFLSFFLWQILHIVSLFTLELLLITILVLLGSMSNVPRDIHSAHPHGYWHPGQKCCAKVE